MQVGTGGAIFLVVCAAIYGFIDKFLPQRCVVVGKTRIAFSFKMDANLLMSERGTFNYHEPSTGIVVDLAYEYVIKKPGTTRLPGVYLNNTKFPSRGYIVRMDDGQLVYVPLENARPVSGYRYAIKSLCVRTWPFDRIKDHEPELVGDLFDIVRLSDDPSTTERQITEILFTPAGEARYHISMTDNEIRIENNRRRKKAEERDRAWSPLYRGASIGRFTADKVIFIRKGIGHGPGMLEFIE